MTLNYSFGNTTFLLVLFFLYVVYRVKVVVTGLRSVHGVPVQFTLVAPLSIPGVLFPPTRWTPGTHYVYNSWDTAYARNGFDAVLFVPLFAGHALLYNASPEAHRQVVSQLAMFEKPEQGLKLDILGPNVVASNGEQWRKHRRITAPAFSQETYADVWNVTARLYYQMQASDEWRTTGALVFPKFQDVTTRLALLVIAATGFNMRIDWGDAPEMQGLRTSVDEMVMTVSATVLLRILAPDWLFNLPNRFLRKVKYAYEDLETYLHAEVERKRADIRKQTAGGGTADDDDSIFGRLVAASEAEGARGLNKAELTGNLFIFLFAGHETTASTLVITLALLAAHPEEQDKVYNHIKETIGDREPTFHDYNSLLPVMYPFYEASRLFPTAFVNLREALSDTVVQYPDASGSGVVHDVFLRRGAVIILDQIGLNRNPRKYVDPGRFMPSRWEARSLDDLLSFSVGPRMCIGKKFTLTEAACFLTLLLRDWRVEIDKKGFASVEEWKAKYLYPDMVATMKTGDVPLRLVKRVH